MKTNSVTTTQTTTTTGATHVLAKAGGLIRWNVHGSLYIELLEKRLQMYEEDPLKQGKEWKYWIKLVRDDIRSSPKYIHELLDLLQNKYTILAFKSGSHIPDHVQAYLQDLSSASPASCSDDKRNHFLLLSQYKQYIHRITVLPSRLLDCLPKKERRQLALDAIQKQDWRLFEDTRNYLPGRKFPYLSFIQSNNASGETLWNLLLTCNDAPNKHDDEITNIPATKLTKFQEHAFGRTILYASIQMPLRTSIEILLAWADWHLKFPPPSLSDYYSSLSKKGKEKLWKLWYDSYFKLIKYLAPEVIKCACKATLVQRPKERTRITLYARYLTEIVKMVSQGLSVNNDKDVIQKQPYLMQLLHDMLLTKVYGKLFDFSMLPVVKELNVLLDQMVINHVLPNLESLLDFDPCNNETYMNKNSLNLFLGIIKSVVSANANRHKSILISRIADIFVNAMDAARVDDAHVALPNNLARFRVCDNRFAYYRVEDHQQAISQCIDQAIYLLTMIKKNNHRDDDRTMINILQKLWPHVRQVKQESQFELYIQCCQDCIWGEVYDHEKPNIVQRARKLFSEGLNMAGALNMARTLACMGLLSAVLERRDGDDSSAMRDTIRTKIMLTYGSFDEEEVQTLLKEQTFGPDPDQRITALQEYIFKAIRTDRVDSIAKALEYMVIRLKNEAGNRRSVIFGHFVAHLLGKTVQISLLDNNKEQSSTATTFETHQRICDALETMWRNDLSRLDSISKDWGANEPSKQILSAVLDHDPKSLQTDLRQMWITFAIRLQWVLTEALNGETALRCYAWPIATAVLPSASWVSAQMFDSMYSIVESPVQLSMLQRRVNLFTSVREDFDLFTDVFGPRQCVKMLQNALESVWDDTFQCPAVKISEPSFEFPQEKEVAAALRTRLIVLYRLCGANWQESPELTDAFDCIFANLSLKSKHHFEHAVELLRNIILIYENGNTSIFSSSAFENDVQPKSCFFDVPRLAGACDQIFRHAAANFETNVTQQWLAPWAMLYLERGVRKWEELGINDDDRVMQFLFLFGRDCEPAKIYNPQQTQGMKKGDLQQCLLVRDILNICPSSILIPGIRKILIANRADIFVQIIERQGALIGAFGHGDYPTMDAFLYDVLSPSLLVTSFPPSVSQRYAKYALSVCANSRATIFSRTEAMQNYVASPSTNHATVLEAFEGEMDEVLKEALMVKIFSLDSPWLVLGYLLSMPVIRKNDQRITSSLLSHIGKHVHVDKVVQVLGLLLTKNRRKELGFQLHKAILRMLFEARTSESIRVLKNESLEDLHKDIRHLIIAKCMESVCKNFLDADWEWSILEETAKDSNVCRETAFLFFSPYRYSAISLLVPVAEGVENETLKSFTMETFIKVNSNELAKKLSSLTQNLEINSADETIRIMAKCQRLRLSALFAPSKFLQDDLDSLDEMALYLSTPVVSWGHREQFAVRNIAKYFASGCARSLIQALDDLPAAERNVILLKNHPVANKFRGCLTQIVSNILDTPMRQIQTRTQNIVAVQILLQTFQTSTNRYKDLFKLLVEEEPLKSEFEIIKHDIDLMKVAF